MDDTATMVLDHLQKMNLPFIRFNTDQFQEVITMTLDLDNDFGFTGVYHFPDRDVCFDEIAVVWNRRVHPPKVNEELDCDPMYKQWALEESRYGLYSSFSQIRAPIINPWIENERLKYDKLLQMREARKFGFSVPQTRITSNLENIWSFWEEVNHDMIFKKIRHGRFEFEDGRRFVLHTSKVREEDMSREQLPRMKFCPLFLEEHIPKKWDIRSIVVNDRVFSVAIHSQAIDEGRVDYRTASLLGKLSEMKHEEICLGDEVNKKLVSMTKSFGLVFNTIDLIETPKGEIFFLECNPNGQWAWLEILTGIPISVAFANHLSTYL